MIGHDSGATTAENYQRFARFEARGRSRLYEDWATAIASDAEVLAFLGRLPRRNGNPTSCSPQLDGSPRHQRPTPTSGQSSLTAPASSKS
jgi:hypothetical protein